jgi:hypothetical protein
MRWRDLTFLMHCRIKVAWNDPGSGLAARAVSAATGTALAATTEGADTNQAEATWVAAAADSGAHRSAMATGRAQVAWPMYLQAKTRCHLGAPRARVLKSPVRAQRAQDRRACGPWRVRGLPSVTRLLSCGSASAAVPRGQRTWAVVVAAAAAAAAAAAEAAGVPAIHRGARGTGTAQAAVGWSFRARLSASSVAHPSRAGWEAAAGEDTGGAATVVMCGEGEEDMAGMVVAAGTGTAAEVLQEAVVLQAAGEDTAAAADVSALCCPFER